MAILSASLCRLVVITPILLLLASKHALAVDQQGWRVIGKSAAGETALFMDSSVRRDGDFVSFWIKIERADGARSASGQRVRSTTIRQKLDCKREVVQVLSFAEYGDSDAPLSSGVADDPEVHPILAGSISEVVRPLVCDVPVRR